MSVSKGSTRTGTRRGAVVYEVLTSSAWLRLNRPDALNALDPQLLADLNGALDEAEQDDAVRVVVITGKGRAFCAGADIKLGTGKDGHAEVTTFLEGVSATLRRIEAFPKPVVAAVNGTALGGGFELILACDLVVAAASARLGDGHAVYGFVPAGGATVRLPRRVGPNHAKFLMLTGDLVSVSDPRLAGLVSEIVEDEDLETAVRALCDTIGTRSPLGIRRMKELLNDSLDQTPAVGFERELLVSDEHRRSLDQAEGIAAFAERRTPRFIGR